MRRTVTVRNKDASRPSTVVTIPVFTPKPAKKTVTVLVEKGRR